MRRLILLLCLLILITLVGCSKEPLNSSEPISSSCVSTTTQSETDSFPSSESINTPSSDKKEPSNQEIGSDTTSNTSKPTETTSSKPTETQGTSSKPSSTESTTESQKETVSEKAFSKLSFSYTGYKSSNEPTPYLKDILYSGSRAQVGDTLIFKIDCDPADATDTVVIGTSDNLSYKISGNTLSITVNSSGAYSVGSLSVSSKLNPSLSKSFRFTIDSAGNPLNDFSSILSEYISYKGMEYCTVEKGYTTEDPSLSITKYSGAPAWDDMISRQSDNWMQKCLWLIDEYKKHSLGKVNFIISPTEIGFSASK